MRLTLARHSSKLGSRPLLVLFSVLVLSGCVRVQAQLSDREAVQVGASLNENAAAALESKFSSNPDDLESGFKLLGYYWAKSLRTPTVEARRAFIRQMEWAIGHAPDSSAFRTRNLHFVISDFPSGSDDYPRIVAVWNKQIAEHPGNTKILHNAVGSFLAMPICISYADQLRKSDPYDVGGVLPFAMALGATISAVQDGPGKIPSSEGIAKIAAFTISSFEVSKDAALVGTTGKGLMDMAASRGERNRPSALTGSHFLLRAQAIDPANPKWKSAAASLPETVPGETEFARLYRWLDEEDLWPGRVVPPVIFPGNPVEVPAPTAWKRQYMRSFGQDIDVATAGIPGAHKNELPEMPSQFDGKVKVDLLVDEKGRIVRDVPLSGDAEHIGEAEDFLDTWRFHPWLVNDRPVAFHSIMTINYRRALGGAAIGGVLANGALRAAPAGAIVVKVGDRTGGNAPLYPMAARMVHVEGVVKLECMISEEGKVESLSVLNGPPLLQKAAIDAVKTWTYKPHLIGGKPVRVLTEIDVVFSLEQTPAQNNAPASQSAPVTSQPRSTPQ